MVSQKIMQYQVEKSIIRVSTLHEDNSKFLCRKSFNVVRNDCLKQRKIKKKKLRSGQGDYPGFNFRNKFAKDAMFTKHTITKLSYWN